jgi:diguanylate cyclase (GGDEF)-like protein/PAS domain S-box-containing protein
MDASDYGTIRQLFDEYLRMYSSRDDRLTEYFSEDFSGFTGGGDFLVKVREQWVAITRQDFAQIKDPIRIELKDLAVQSLADTVAVAASTFTLHLPIEDHVLSRKTARLVLVFRKESAGWKISHSSISIPFGVVREGEVYPMEELFDRNQLLQALVAERMIQISAANDNLQKTNEELEREIAEHKQAADALQRSEERYRSVVNASPDDITITDREGRILMVSPVAWPMFGCEREEEFLGRPITDFIVPEDRDRARFQIALKLQGVITGSNEYRGLRPDGSSFDIEVKSEFIRDAEELPTGMVVIVRDITERKQAEADKEKLEATNRQLQKALQEILLEQSTHDALTGLYNRRYLEETIGRELISAERHGHPVSVIMGDLDHFKEINDRYGHPGGDEVLRVFGDLMKRHARGSDIYCRYGGEEFLLVLPEMAKDDAVERAKQLCSAMAAAPVPYGDSAIAVTASFGVAAFPRDGRNADDLIAAADSAMYAAKAGGRNRVNVSSGPITR